MRLNFAYIVIFLASSMLYSQNTSYQFRQDQIFDNREYYSDYGFPQTIFGARIDASVHFSIDTAHTVVAGLNYMYEYGSTLFGIEPQADLYYHYRGSKLDMYLGSFPRYDKLNMPLSFLNDTLNYYRPNVEGAFFHVERNWMDLKAFADWTGRVSEERRESFLMGLDLQFKAASFFLRPSFLMYHNARSYDPADSVSIQDNGIFSLLFGFNYCQAPSGFNMSVSAGMLNSYNRFRPDAYSWGNGLLANIDMAYNIFGIRGVYYYGSPLNFEYGDPFYRAGNYGRLDLYLDPFSHPKIDAKIGWNFHLIPGEGIHNSQQILITILF